MRGPLNAALVAGLAAGGLVGCSGPQDPSPRPAVEASISPQQGEALADRRVTWDEYQAGFQAYQACLSSKGFELSSPAVKGDLMDFGVPAAAVESGVDDACYQYHWAQVDEVWQITHEDTSESALIIADCLRSKGVAPEEKYSENVALLKEHGIDLADCPADG